MKVLCINNTGVEDYLTIGKWYYYEDTKTDPSSSLFKSITEFGYRVKHDLNYYNLLPKEHFKTQQEVREEKLRQLGI